MNRLVGAVMNTLVQYGLCSSRQAASPHCASQSRTGSSPWYRACRQTGQDKTALVASSDSPLGRPRVTV